MLKINAPSNPPDVIIGPEDNPYMRRWWIKKDKHSDLYLHQICRSDDARALHDHRADNESIILSGRYQEIIAPNWMLDIYDVHHPQSFERGPGDVIYRKAEQPHRLVILEGPVWTLWRKFGDRRDWGFWVPRKPLNLLTGYGLHYPREGKNDAVTYVWQQWKDYVDEFGESEDFK